MHVTGSRSSEIIVNAKHLTYDTSSCELADHIRSLPIPAFEQREMTAPVKYIAKIHGVEEVTLLASADLDYWKEHLKSTGLCPYDADGRAQFFISATQSRWMGIPFREFVISLYVCRHEEGATRDGLYLVSAFNSLRSFAWIERTMFHTPYLRGQIEVQTEMPCALQLTLGSQRLLRAEMSREPRVSQTSEECWEGRIYLPDGRERHTPYFCAKLAGSTEILPFMSSQDVLTLNPACDHPIVRHLAESHCTGSEWHIRRKATHARSKTLFEVL
jgi:hypothetical protein